MGPGAAEEDIWQMNIGRENKKKRIVKKLLIACVTEKFKTWAMHTRKKRELDTNRR